LETRLESKSVEPLIGYPVILVQKLWLKNNKLTNYLIRGLINYFHNLGKKQKDFLPKFGFFGHTF